MGSRSRDLVATLIVVAIGIPYVGYLVRGEMPFVQDPRGMTGVGLVLGIVAFFVASRDVPADLVVPLMVLAAASGALGLVSLALAEAGVAEALLGVFMGSVLMVWLLDVSRYLAGLVPARRHELSHA
jgi:hypothetical protein